MFNSYRSKFVSVSAFPDNDDDGDSGRPKPTGQCFRCGEEGHWARQCRGISRQPCTLLYGVTSGQNQNSGASCFECTEQCLPALTMFDNAVRSLW
jgi:hypothetical protein